MYHILSLSIPRYTSTQNQLDYVYTHPYWILSLCKFNFRCAENPSEYLTLTYYITIFPCICACACTLVTWCMKIRSSELFTTATIFAGIWWTIFAIWIDKYGRLNKKGNIYNKNLPPIAVEHIRSRNKHHCNGIVAVHGKSWAVPSRR